MTLGIELLRVDFVKEYWDDVLLTLFLEHQSRTPNPDILCNKYIKFDAFLILLEVKVLRWLLLVIMLE